MTKQNKTFPYGGRWTAKDCWQTDIEFIISKRGDKVTVAAMDQSDGEGAEIYCVKLRRDGLYFAAYWSSGQFTKYRLRPIGDNEIEVVFTYTDTAHFARKRSPRKPTRPGRGIDKRTTP
jgi:hypothetical protein